MSGLTGPGRRGNTAPIFGAVDLLARIGDATEFARRTGRQPPRRRGPQPDGWWRLSTNTGKVVCGWPMPARSIADYGIGQSERRRSRAAGTGGGWVDSVAEPVNSALMVGSLWQDESLIDIRPPPCRAGADGADPPAHRHADWGCPFHRSAERWLGCLVNRARSRGDPTLIRQQA